MSTKRTPRIACVWGSITAYSQRGRARWRLRGPDGRSAGLYDTIDAAQRAAEALRDELGETPIDALSVGAWGTQWLRDLERRGRKVAGSYRQVWSCYVEGTSLERRSLRKCRPEHVRQWLHDLSMRTAQRGRRQGERLSEGTLRNALRCVSAAYRDAIEAGRATANPTRGVRVPKMPQTEEPWTYLTRDEVDALLSHPLLPQRQRVIFTVAIYTGLRAGELWGLHWEDVHLGGDRPELVVRYSYDGPTKGNRVRRVPLLPPAVEALQEWRTRRGVTRMSGLVFHAGGVKAAPSMHAKGYGAQWSARREGKAMAPGWRDVCGVRPEVRFHDLRHTCASLLISGAWGRAWRLEEVQVMLGHASRTTTERYAHLAPEGMASAYDEAVRSWQQSGSSDFDHTSKGAKY